MESKRKNYFIDKSFQTKFILQFSALMVASAIFMSIVVLVLSGRFTTVAIEGASIVVKSAADFLIPVLVLSIFVAMIFCALAVTALTLFTSHKIAGPLYRTKREIERFASGDLSANFATRRDDQLKDLTKALVEMGETYRTKQRDLKDAITALKDSAKKGAPKEEVEKKIEIVDHIASYFRW